MVREAVKQYAVDPKRLKSDPSVSPNDPQYPKLKALAKTDPEMAKMLGYTPEIEGAERTFGSTGDPIMRFIVNRTESLDSEPDEFDLQMNFMMALKELSEKMKELLRTGDAEDGRLFYAFADNLYHKLIDLTYEGYDDGSIPSMQKAIFVKSPKVVKAFKRNHPEAYAKVINAVKEIQ